VKEPTIEQVAAIAWDLIRSDTDPVFDSCQIDHKDKLFYHARDVQKTGKVDDDFERKVREVLSNPAAAITAIKARYMLPEPEPVSDQPPEPVAEPKPEKPAKRSILKRSKK